jgi:hypothetical protein
MPPSSIKATLIFLKAVRFSQSAGVEKMIRKYGPPYISGDPCDSTTTEAGSSVELQN